MQSDIVGTFFTTMTTLGRRPVFLTDPNSQLFLNTLFACRDDGIFSLHEFVLMPDHVHLLFTTGISLSVEQAVQSLKDRYADAFLREFDWRMDIWEPRARHHRIRDWQDYQKHRKFIHENPVHAGFVELPEDYPCCSAHASFWLDSPLGNRELRAVRAI